MSNVCIKNAGGMTRQPRIGVAIWSRGCIYGGMNPTPDKGGCLLALPELVVRLFHGKPAGERAGAAAQHMKGKLVTPRNIIIALLALVYAVWPADILSDIIPIVGWLDDIGVLAIAVSLITAAVYRRTDNLPEEDQSTQQERPMRNCTPSSPKEEDKQLEDRPQ